VVGFASVIKKQKRKRYAEAITFAFKVERARQFIWPVANDGFHGRRKLGPCLGGCECRATCIVTFTARTWRHLVMATSCYGCSLGPHKPRHAHKTKALLPFSLSLPLSPLAFLPQLPWLRCTLNFRERNYQHNSNINTCQCKYCPLNPMKLAIQTMARIWCRHVSTSKCSY